MFTGDKSLRGDVAVLKTTQKLNDPKGGGGDDAKKNKSTARRIKNDYSFSFFLQLPNEVDAFF